MRATMEYLETETMEYAVHEVSENFIFILPAVTATVLGVCCTFKACIVRPPGCHFHTTNMHLACVGSTSSSIIPSTCPCASSSTIYCILPQTASCTVQITFQEACLEKINKQNEPP